MLWPLVLPGNQQPQHWACTINRFLSSTLGRILTHWGLVTPHGDRELSQPWLRKWLVAWRHQAITWTNVDWSSVKSSDIHVRAISQEMPQPSITKICLKITCLKFHSYFPGANELSPCTTVWLTLWLADLYIVWETPRLHWILVNYGLKWPVGISTIFQTPLTVLLQSPNDRQMPAVRAVQWDPETV